MCLLVSRACWGQKYKGSQKLLEGEMLCVRPGESVPPQDGGCFSCELFPGVSHEEDVTLLSLTTSFPEQSQRGCK